MTRLLFFCALLIGMAVYITLSAHSLFRSGILKKTPSVPAWIISIIPVAAGLALIPVTRGLTASVIALGHLTALLVLRDMVMYLIQSDRIDKDAWKSALFVASFVICAAYITYGAINAYTVSPTFYTISTGKASGMESLRIAHISDCHTGTTFDGPGFARHIEAINAHNPDLLVITGDFADSRTTPEEMASACAVLENVQAPLGVYYVSGNHEDRMNPQKNNELRCMLENSGVTVLEDERAVITDGVVLCGRKDAYNHSRLSISQLLQTPDGQEYTIFLDHQPREYDIYTAHGADLVLSGHTHAGQLFPLGLFIEAIGMGENTYGMEQRGDTTFIVSSGMSGLLPLRTEAKSEYVIIDITFSNNKENDQ